MGWWKAGGGVIGDEPLDALGGALTKVLAAYQRAWGRRPTRDEWERLLTLSMGLSEPEYRVMDDAVPHRVVMVPDAEPSAGAREEPPLTEAELDLLEGLCGATTPGPWISFIEGRDHVSGSDFIRTASEDIEMSGASHADQDFIAAAHEALPRVLREVRALRQR